MSLYNFFVFHFLFKYEQAATPLSVGSIRQQFSLRENILLSLFSHGFIRSISEHLLVEGDDPPDVQFVDSCYLFLASKQGERALKENYETQKRVGADVELLTPKMLKEIFPWMNVRGVTLGCRGIYTYVGESTIIKFYYMTLIEVHSTTCIAHAPQITVV